MISNAHQIYVPDPIDCVRLWPPAVWMTFVVNLIPGSECSDKSTIFFANEMNCFAHASQLYESVHVPVDFHFVHTTNVYCLRRANNLYSNRKHDPVNGKEKKKKEKKRESA